MIGHLPHEGFIMLDDKPTYGPFNLFGTLPEFEGIWMVDYDDTVNPVRNDVQLTPIEIATGGVKPDRATSLSATEITWWKNWVETTYQQESERRQAVEDAEQRAADESLISTFGDWTLNNKATRDNLLINSDAYEMLEHLKSAGWSEWRQWLRDLPSTHPDPLTIEWKEPPSNVNSSVKRSFDNWKQRVTFTKEVKEKL